MVEGGGVEADRLALAPVERDGKVGAVDRLNGAGRAVDDARLLVGRRELDAVAGGEGKAAVRGR